MSVSVAYLFNSDLALATLVTRLNNSLGLAFTPYEGNSSDQFCRFLGMELSLKSGHGLENDGECNFQDYEFIIEYSNTGPRWRPALDAG